MTHKKHLMAAIFAVLLYGCTMKLVTIDPAPLPTSRPSVATTQPVIAGVEPWYSDYGLWQYIGASIAAVGVTVGYFIKRRKA